MNALYLPVMFFLCHFVPDFWLQSPWMALNKSKKTWNCLVHVLIYTSCFTILTLSWKALLFIGITHFILDRWHVILRRMIWWKNHFPTGKYPPFEYCDTTGYFDTSPINTKKVELKENEVMINPFWGTPQPFYITIWLYIFQDNILHLVCNFIALMYLAS